MSNNTNVNGDRSVPGIPSAASADVGSIAGRQTFVGMPQPANGKPLPNDPAAAQAKVHLEEAKERTAQADRSAPGLVDQIVRPNSPIDQGAVANASTSIEVVGATDSAPQIVDMSGAAKAADASATFSIARKPRSSKAKELSPRVVKPTKQADAVAKPPRKARATAKAAEVSTQDGVAGADVPGSARSRRTKVSKASPVAEQGLPSVGQGAVSGSPDIPPMTEEALTFLRNADATVAELFKLQPQSLRFVQYHITNMQRMEAELAQSYDYLMATSPKYSPEFEKVADALVEKLVKNGRAGITPSVNKTEKHVAVQGVIPSYRPMMARVSAYELASVQLGKMEISEGGSIGQAQDAKALQSAKDIARANKVMGTAHMMMSSPIGDVTRQQANDLVEGDLADVRSILDKRALQLALNAMAESSYAQPQYHDAFERLAPDLVAAAEKAIAAMDADQVIGNSARRFDSKNLAQGSENTIERGIAPELENLPAAGLQQAAPSQPPTAPGVKQASPALGLGRRMLHAMGVWLLDKAEEKPAKTPGSKAEPADKAAPVIAANDKAYLIPKAVAQRFLKVEHDYYFHDKTPAFSDRGTKLATRGAHPEVVRSLIEIAMARGWDSITVKGTDEFRRSAWMDAAQAGLKVAGYKPTALDLADVASKPAANIVEKGVAKEREALATTRSPAQPATAPTAAQSPEAATSKETIPSPSPELAAKARAFDKEKPVFVMKKFPELAQAYGVVDAAKKFAEAHLTPDVRDEFVALARRHVMQKILAGEHVKGPQINIVPAKTTTVADRAEVSTQTTADMGTSSRSKQLGRDR